MHTRVQELMGHYADLRKQLIRELRDPDYAADIAQSSFERVYAHVFGATGRGNPAVETNGIKSLRALLFRVARNLCIDEARHNQVVHSWRQERMAAQSYLSHPSCEYVFSQRQILRRIIEILENLPARRRKVFLLSRVYGYRHAEIAAMLGISSATVAKHLVRAVLDCTNDLKTLRRDLIEPRIASGHVNFNLRLAEDGL